MALQGVPTGCPVQLPMKAEIKGFGCGIGYLPGNHPERACKGCGVLFCPRRKDQLYPDEKCRWRSRDRSLSVLVGAIGDPDEIEALGQRLLDLAAAVRKSRSPTES